MRKISVSLAGIGLLGLALMTALAIANAKRTAADVLGGNDVVATIEKAEKVEIFRLADMQFFQDKPADYKVNGEAVALDPKMASSLATTLVAFDSYEREVAKACEPIFGVKAVFTQGESKVDVVFCFSCEILAVYHQGKHTGDGNFDPANAKLVALVKQLFPKDKAIQAIGTK
ncbi:MAG TPA: hypothetical protein VL096_22245 [Pirellulaceae bacterium]|nr:hypothetical protein [Pirellulaceae bacterium]